MLFQSHVSPNYSILKALIRVRLADGPQTTGFQGMINDAQGISERDDVAWRTFHRSCGSPRRQSDVTQS